MSEPVKRHRSRRYDSSRRQQQADQNRAAVLAAARDRFLVDGYTATTLAAVAGAAGVSVETIYKAFANKAGVLKAVVDVAIAGDDEPRQMADRDVIGAIVNEPDPARKLERYGAHLADTMPRSAPVQLLARDAAAADSGAADVWAQIRGEILHAMTLFAENLGATGRLRVSTDEARDLLWTYHSPELYELLVLERGWTPARYGDFFAAAVTAALIEPKPGSRLGRVTGITP
jgi:AcrR family transcriptional regulator